jgi:hypothetical protein
MRELFHKAIPEECNESIRPDSTCLVGQSTNDAFVDSKPLLLSIFGFAWLPDESSNLLCLISVPYCDLNLWQPFLQFVNIAKSLGEALAIQEKVDSFDLSSFGRFDAFTWT